MESGTKKIDDIYLESFRNLNLNNFFGEWINQCDLLSDEFNTNNPFNHIVIDDFLNTQYAEELQEKFPSNYDNWHKYCNPIEYKYAFDDINSLDATIKDYFYLLSCPQFVTIMNKLTKINNLEMDPFLHGAGLHAHGRYGKLDIHLDYEKHPFCNKERRINIILFLNKEWNTRWNGANELWNNNVTKCMKKTEIKFNRAIIFQTNDVSWHGMPEKVLCPENIFRKSLAYYYISPIITSKPEDHYRSKATYTQTSTSYNEGHINKLYEIRAKRRITKEDILLYCPNWSIEK